MRIEVIPLALLLKPGHARCAGTAFGLPVAKYYHRLAVLLNEIIDETVGRFDLEPLRAPPKFWPRSGVTLTDEVHPEGVAYIRRQAIWKDWKLLLACDAFHCL